MPLFFVMYAHICLHLLQTIPIPIAQRLHCQLLYGFVYDVIYAFAALFQIAQISHVIVLSWEMYIPCK